MEQDLVNRAGSITFNPAISNCSNSDLTVNTSSMRDIPCTLQNCDLNTSCSLIRSTSSLSSTGGTIIGSNGGCYSAPSTMKINQQNQTSNQSLAQILATNQSTQNLYEHWNSIDCMGAGTISQTILPPPLFDTNCTTAAPGNYNQCYEIQNHPGNYCTLSAIEMPKMPSSSKRLHRTIPKHFTMSSPSSSAVLSNNDMTQNAMRSSSSSNNNNIMSSGGSANSSNNSNEQNKKSSCQCPVQHVPMTYMQFSSAQVAQSPLPLPPQQMVEIQQQQHVQQQQATYAQQQRHQQHSAIYMSSSNSSSGGGGGGGSKKNNVIKSTTYPSAMNVQNVSASGKIQTITNSSEILGADMLQHTSAATHIDMGASAIISSGSSSGTLRRSHKSLSNASAMSSANMAMPTTPNKKSIATISIAQSPIPQSSTVASSYFAPTSLAKMDGKPQQQIHSILKNKNSASCHINVINVTDACSLEQNPILPPKMYNKNNNGKYSITPTNSGSKQIHTITRPNELTTSSSQFTLLSINGGGGGGGSSSGGSAQKYQQQYHQQQQPTQLRTNIQVGRYSLFFCHLISSFSFLSLSFDSFEIYLGNIVQYKIIATWCTWL